MTETEESVEFDMNLEVEFDQLIQPDVLEAFYQNKFYFSYSSLKKLLYHPPAFYEHYILNQREEKLTKNLVNGKLIHCLILQPDELNEQFIISPAKVPEGNNLSVVNAAYKHHLSMGGSDTQSLADYPNAILEFLAQINLHQSLVDGKKPGEASGDDKRLAKIITEENIIYFDFLKTRGTKNIIDDAQMSYCKKAANLVSGNSKMRKLMGLDGKDNEVINEKLLFAELKMYKFGLKGILDNVNIDHYNKIIYINDLKTTAKELSTFEETVKFFDYNLQAVMYCQLIAANYGELIYQKGYKVEFRFMVIDKFLQTYDFRVTDATMDNWLLEFNHCLTKADYHYTSRSYDLPYAFDRRKVVL